MLLPESSQDLPDVDLSIGLRGLGALPIDITLLSDPCDRITRPGSATRVDVQRVSMFHYV